MSDEEKKAIESLIEIREFANLSNYKDTKISQLNAIDIVLNLIEKQSKEIEEYKKQLDLDYVDNHFVPIERYNQLKKEIEELKDKNKKLQDKAKELIFEKQELTSALLDSTPNDKIKAKIEELDYNDIGNFERRCKQEVLQSLLEKE